MIQIRNIRQTKYVISQQELRLNNTMLVFNLIRDLMPISRIELAKRSPFSSSTISNLVDELLQNHWIVETATVQNSARGRRSTLLEVNAHRGCVATVELLGRGYICTLYDICLKKIAGTRIRNTVYDSADGKTVTCVPDRSRLYQAQTPQTFRIGLLKELYARLTPYQKAHLTDTCSICSVRDYPVHMAAGSYLNIKITTPEDLRIAETLARELL